MEGCIQARMHTHFGHVPLSLMLARAASSRHVSPLSGCGVLIAPAAVATIPPGGHWPHTSWELWREGVVRAGVERERCRTEVCG